MSKFTEDVKKELEAARIEHPERMHSHHEAFGVLYEELLEYLDEVRVKDSKRDFSNMYLELVQIAAVANRAAEDLL